MSREVDITQNSNHATVEIFRGFSVRENAGSPAAAAVNFRKNSVSGQIIGVLELAANESATLALSKKNKRTSEGGVYVQVTAGSIEGVLYTE